MAESIQVQLRKGTLELCALAVLARGENYGYEIANILINTVSMGEGTIYPLMRRMQNDGHVATRIVESSSGPPRKYYSLTMQGRNALEAHLRDWRAFAGSVDKLLEDLP
ncbi:PadR family transcriptional regulator [Rhizobium leguminosarum]|uniref:PadR family transcriptional regulator n=1 Tax=Rhizobium leguminosarum TaxID=384 RepID=UPI003F99CB01